MPTEQLDGTADAPPAFSENEVICSPAAGDAAALLGEMVRRIASTRGMADPEKALAAVLERQAAAPVFIAPGVAVPHARVDGIGETSVCIAVLPHGIRFEGSAEPVRLVILVLTPKDSPAGYLRVMAGVARKIAKPGFIDGVVAMKAPGEIAASFLGAESRMDGEVSVRDLMVAPPAILRETNSVKEAIDTVVATGLTEIPVVDKEGDLVGVASARAILGICIPEYLLWMEDLSRFSNFEPFGTLLKKESSTWLADIMDDDFAAVQADSPAIAAAEALARRRADTCYVLEGARLAGVVGLPRFLHNIFRD
ncbi:MAG: PTS sugar transporter subunit IIA [Kiritimatiellae bacterium]|nr:PTS sugar transporter subunit IIA [Kiritimatiellia bacterium]